MSDVSNYWASPSVLKAVRKREQQELRRPVPRPVPAKSRRWASEQQFLEALNLRQIERVERRNAERRKLNLHAKLGTLSADEQHLLPWPSSIGKVE